MDATSIQRIQCATSLRALAETLNSLSSEVLDRSRALEAARDRSSMQIRDYRAISLAGQHAFDVWKANRRSEEAAVWEAARRFRVPRETVLAHFKRLKRRENLAHRQARKSAIIKMSRRRPRKAVAAHFGISQARVCQIIAESRNQQASDR